MGYKLIKSPNNLSGFYLVHMGSTLNEHDGIYGISHLMEHLMCKNIDHLRDDYEKDGIVFNAYTSSTKIVFYITGLNRYVNKWKKIIHDELTDFRVDDGMLEKEKNIVIEEYLDYFNDQSNSHYLNLNRKLFDDYDPIGKLQDIKNITLQDCKNFYDLQFNKKHMVIDISSNNKQNDIEYFINQEYNNKLSQKEFVFGNYDYVHQESNIYKDKVSIINFSNIITTDFDVNMFVPYLLSSGLGSPLYDEIREKRGLIYSLSYSFSPRNNYNGHSTFSTETNKKNKKDVQDIFVEVISNPKKYITKKRFEVTKRKLMIYYQKQKYNDYKNEDKYITPEFSLSTYIKNVKYVDIMDKYDKYFNVDNYYFSTDDTEFK